VFEPLFNLACAVAAGVENDAGSSCFINPKEIRRKEMDILCRVSQSSGAGLPALNQDEVRLSFRAHWHSQVRMLSDPNHAVSIVRVPEGVGIWICCGHKPGYWVGRDELADPYLLDIQDPALLLRELTEVFARG